MLSSPEAADTTGKTGAAVQLIFAVSPRTAKKSLSCTKKNTHVKELQHGKKNRHERMAKKSCTTKK
jgi:hypothetical protein